MHHEHTHGPKRTENTVNGLIWPHTPKMSVQVGVLAAALGPASATLAPAAWIFACIVVAAAGADPRSHVGSVAGLVLRREQIVPMQWPAQMGVDGHSTGVEQGVPVRVLAELEDKASNEGRDLKGREGEAEVLVEELL